MLKPAGNQITVSGELAARIEMNTARMSSPCYRPDAIYTADQAGWPGDWEGRTILALVSLWKASGTRPAYLDRIIESLPSHLNEKGYLGPVAEDGLIDEQQLSGHNWLLRGLTEYFIYTNDGVVGSMILKIVAGLYLPLAGKFATYPTDPEQRKAEGSYSGEINGVLNGWKLSTDIGCAFISLDALSQVYEKFRVPKFGALAREMADAFLKIDLTGARMQTHATLSATRGILRLAEKDNDEALLKAAQKVFGLYVASGMTENFANFNWFSRPDTWTEPCAIVDSMMCALTLFRLTEDPYYARLANRIWYNGLGFAQRPNGGFGTDRCVGPAGDVLTPSSGGISEAYWCCTMRGAEGLRARAEGSFYVSADTDLTTFPDYQMIAHAPRKYDIWLPFSTDADYSCDFFTLKVRSSLPESGPVKITAKALAPISLTLHIYTPDAPDGFRTRTLTLEPAESKTISETVKTELSRVRSADGRKFKYMRGDLLLGLTEPKDAANPLSAAGFQPGDELSEELKAKLRPINDVIDLSFDDAANTQRRLLF